MGEASGADNILAVDELNRTNNKQDVESSAGGLSRAKNIEKKV